MTPESEAPHERRQDDRHGARRVPENQAERPHPQRFVNESAAAGEKDQDAKDLDETGSGLRHGWEPIPDESGEYSSVPRGAWLRRERPSGGRCSCTPWRSEGKIRVGAAAASRPAYLVFRAGSPGRRARARWMTAYITE